MHRFIFRAMGWCIGGPGAIPGPGRRHMWVEFVVRSCPCSEGFSPGSPFFPPLKATRQIPTRP